MQTNQDTLKDELAALGRELRRAREQDREWTRPQMVKATGISDSTITRAERGDRIRLDYLAAVAAAVGVKIPESIADFLTRAAIDDTSSSAAAPDWFVEHMQAAEERARHRHDELLTRLTELHGSILAIPS